jgi:ribosomal protein L31
VHPDNEEKKFFCNHCPKSFIYRDSMKKHMDTVKEKSEYQQKLNINCDYCKEVFDSTSAIKNHYKNVHPNKPMMLPGRDSSIMRGMRSHSSVAHFLGLTLFSFNIAHLFILEWFVPILTQVSLI